MASSSVSPSAMREAAGSIASSLGVIDDMSGKLKGELSSCNDQYGDIIVYDGQYLDDEISDFVDYYNNKVYSYKYLADVYGGEELLDRINKINDSFTELSSLKSQMTSELEKVEAAAKKIEESLEEIEGALGGPSSYYGDGGGDSSYAGSPSVAAAPAIKKAADIAKKAEAAALSFDKNTKAASNSDFLKKADTSDTNNVNNPSVYSDQVADSTSSSVDGSTGAVVSGLNRSGGEYSVSGGYSSLGSSLQEESGKLDGAVASLDQLVKGKKYHIVPFSNIPVLGTDIVKGSAALPITSGLSAVGLSGIGLSALMKHKNDEDDDDENNDSSEVEYEIEKEEPVQEELEEYGKTKTLSDFENESQVEEEKDTFSISDFIGSGLE